MNKPPEDHEAVRAAALKSFEGERAVIGGSPEHLAAIAAGTEHKIRMVFWPKGTGPKKVY